MTSPRDTKYIGRCPIPQSTPTVFFPQPTGISCSSDHPSRATRAGVQPQPALDISQLDVAVECFMENCVAPTTRSAYNSAQRRYAAFCVKYGVCTPYPVQEDTLCRYVAFLAKKGLKHRSIVSYLSGIRWSQIQQALGNPFAHPMRRLEYILSGIKRVETRGGAASRGRDYPSPLISCNS